MKKISYYLIFAVIVGGLLSSFWVYRKYFHREESGFLFFKAEKGPIKEVVKVRGEAVPVKKFNLEFPFSGIVDEVFVKEGQTVSAGEPLMKLETKDYELNLARLEAVLSQRLSYLEKITAGPTEKDVNILKTKVSGAETSFDEAKKTVIDKIHDSYVKSDDAVRGKVDTLFDNPRTANPKIVFVLSDSRLRADIEWNRFLVERALDSWQASLEKISLSENLDLFLEEAKENLGKIKYFLNQTALAVNGLRANSNLSQATIDLWKTNISSARSGVNVATAALLAAEEKYKAAESSLALARSELAFKTAGARKEDLAIARSQINEVRNQIKEAREKIKKSYLYSPERSEVSKITIKERELFIPGRTAIFLSSPELKIRADVSELDIGKLGRLEKGKVLIKFDAFPGAQFDGEVSYIEPKEIVRDGDIYYRTNISFKPGRDWRKVRSGMSADLTITISSKSDAVKIPEIAVYEKNGEKFVKVFQNGDVSERRVETGISDGEYIEVLKGLEEGQTVVVAAD